MMVLSGFGFNFALVTSNHYLLIDGVFFSSLIGDGLLGFEKSTCHGKVSSRFHERSFSQSFFWRCQQVEERASCYLY